jgi:hypothetical protein
MKQVTEQELLNLFNDTLNKCGTYLLNEDDSTIEYSIYEEFDVGVNSFFHEDSLKILLENNLINLTVYKKSSLLRKKLKELELSSDWGIENFKSSLKWKEIMLLADEIKSYNQAPK